MTKSLCEPCSSRPANAGSALIQSWLGKSGGRLFIGSGITMHCCFTTLGIYSALAHLLWRCVGGSWIEAWLHWMHSLTGAGCINIPCSISFRLCLFPEHSEPLNWNAAEELQGRFFAALLHRLSYTLLPALRQNAQLRQLPQLDREVIIFNHPSLQTTSQGEWCIYIT